MIKYFLNLNRIRKTETISTTTEKVTLFKHELFVGREENIIISDRCTPLPDFFKTRLSSIIYGESFWLLW